MNSVLNLSSIRLKSGNKIRYELFLVKSNNHIRAFIYDKKEKKCILGMASCSKNFKSFLKNARVGVTEAKKLGELFVKKVVNFNIDIKNVYYNRGNDKYHGRVKSFCEAFFSNN